MWVLWEIRDGACNYPLHLTLHTRYNQSLCQKNVPGPWHSASLHITSRKRSTLISHRWSILCNALYPTIPSHSWYLVSIRSNQTPTHSCQKNELNNSRERKEKKCIEISSSKFSIWASKSEQEVELRMELTGSKIRSLNACLRPPSLIHRVIFLIIKTISSHPS